jgi:hypothetical protein
MNLFRRLVTGVFSSLASATPARQDPSSASDPLDHAFREDLKAVITNLAPQVQVSLESEQLALAPLGIALETKVVEQTTHPNAVIAMLGVRLSHPRYFPLPLQVYLAGYGTTPAEAVANGAQTYGSGVLAPVLEAMSGTQEPKLDDMSQADGCSWQPVVGPLQVQGAWTGVPDLDPQHLLALFTPLLQRLHFHRPFHWLRLYLSRQPNGEVIVECLLDNEPWEAGSTLLQAEVATWPHAGQFAGQKQLLLFRQGR